MKDNHRAWEREYRDPTFLTLGTEALGEVKTFVKWLKKELRGKVGRTLPDYRALDLGCGNGKNLNYLVRQFIDEGIGYDISPTAIAHAQTSADGLRCSYDVRSIAEPFPLPDQSIDLVLDVTASNALTSREREHMLTEIARVLRPDGYLFTRALCKDGDVNAKNLIKKFPGAEADTYQLGDTGIVERVFTKEAISETYSQFFDIVHLEKTTGYQKWGNQSYKRNYWIMYAKLKA
jgi:SAM-dependent methyltransferase